MFLLDVACHSEFELPICVYPQVGTEFQYLLTPLI